MAETVRNRFEERDVRRGAGADVRDDDVQVDIGTERRFLRRDDFDFERRTNATDAAGRFGGDRDGRDGAEFALLRDNALFLL